MTSHQEPQANSETQALSVDPALLASKTGSAALDEIGMDVFMRSIESVHPFVAGRLSAIGRHDELDAVMQDVRIEAWKSASRYDQARGPFGAFVQGIAQRVILRVNDTDCRYRRADHVPLHDIDERLGANFADPLESLGHALDRRRWMEIVVEHVDPNDWVIAVSAAVNELSSREAVERFAITPSAFRAIKERVGLTALTVKLALQARADEAGVDVETARRCVPEAGQLRTVAAFLPDRQQDLAGMVAATSLSPSQLRHQVPKARRLLNVALDILKPERTG